MAAKKNKRATRETPKFIMHARCEQDVLTLEANPDVSRLIFNGALDAIQHAVADNKKDAEIFRLQDNKSVVYLEKVQWRPVLQEAMHYYAENDVFDNAIKCQSLLQLI
jgi:hypothetical protein